MNIDNWDPVDLSSDDVVAVGEGFTLFDAGAYSAATNSGQFNLTAGAVGDEDHIKLAPAEDGTVVRVDLQTFSQDFQITNQGDGSDLTILFDGANEVFEDADGSLRVTFTGADGVEHEVKYSPGEAEVSVFTAGDSITGGGGDDVLTGSDGGDDVNAGVGDDRVDAGGGNDRVAGGIGADSLDGGEGLDTLVGGTGNDTLIGGEGADRLIGGGGNSTIAGETIDMFSFKVANISARGGEYENWSDVGKYVVYDNVGVTEQGTVVQARISVEGVSDSRFSVDLGVSDTSPVIVNDGIPLYSQEFADIRIEFFDQATGEAIAINGFFTFKDMDATTESVTIGKNDAETVAISTSPASNIEVTDNGDSFTLNSTATMNGGSADQENWATVSFNDQFGMDFTVSGRIGGNAIYDFASAEFDAPPEIIQVGEGDDDSLSGGEGGDTLEGGAGDDILSGDSGDDQLFGGEGGDSLAGGEGDDLIEGGSGDDILTTGLGRDTLFGGAGGDTLHNASGDDSLVGGSGDDSITATAGRDTLDGGAGSDTLSGGSGDDLLIGGSGDDLIDAGGQNDQIYGGAGSDTLLGNLSDGAGNLFDGGSGDDVLIIGGSSVDGLSFNIDLDAGTDNFGNQYASIETILGGTADETISGAAAAERFEGGDGDDSLSGAGGADTLISGAGDDTIAGGAGGDSIDGSTGLDFLDYSESDAAVNVNLQTGFFAGGHATGDSVAGMDGIIGSAFSDTLIGFDAESTVPGDAYTNVIHGGAGEDFIDGRGGDDTLTGGVGADTIIGGDGSDLILGGSGDDSITVGLGQDTAFGGAGDDTILNASGDDSLVGGSGDDSIVATGGADTLEGGAGADTLIGGSGDDSLVGGSGDDVITGSSGDDVAFGGDDQDSFLFADDFGNDTIEGGEGGTDFDTLDFSSLTAPVTVTYTGNEAGTATDGTFTITFSEIERVILTSGDDALFGGADSVGIDVIAGAGADTIYSGVGGDSIDGGSGADEVFGDAGDDTIFGGSGADDLGGDSGDDNVFGGSGDDFVQGMEGADTLEGGAGADTLDGGAGNDSLTGGDGFDFFVLSSGDDTIADFGTATGGVLNDGDPTNNDFIDLSAYYDNIWEARADFADDGILNQSNATDTKGRAVDYGDNTAMSGGTTFQGVASSSAFTEDNTNLVCFAGGTLIATPGGARPVDALTPGDLITTHDRGARPVRWVGRRTVSVAEQLAAPRLRPVRIRADALGPGLPTRDLVVSPQHRVLARGPIVARMFGAPEILLPAKALLGAPGVEREPPRRDIAYVHICLDGHQVIWAEDALTETFYPGPQAMRSLSEADFAAFTQARFATPPGEWTPARPLAPVRPAAAFVRRAIAAGQPIASPSPQIRAAS